MVEREKVQKWKKVERRRDIKKEPLLDISVYITFFFFFQYTQVLNLLIWQVACGKMLY
jgi:hypothetical protein